MPLGLVKLNEEAVIRLATREKTGVELRQQGRTKYVRPALTPTLQPKSPPGNATILSGPDSGLDGDRNDVKERADKEDANREIGVPRGLCWGELRHSE
jgi:hypothetical protein